MPYCYKCGVEVNNGVENCPLCQMDLPVFAEAEILEPRYPSQENVFKEIKKRRKNVFFVVFSFIVLAVLTNLIIIDWKNDTNLSWSIYTSIYLVCSLIYMAVALQYSKNIKINFFVIGITTLLLLFFNDYSNGKLEWFLPLGAPICTVAVSLLYLVFIIFMSQRLLPYKIIYTLLILCGFLVATELMINQFIHNRFFIYWSLQVDIFILPIIIILIFIPRRYYERFNSYWERKMHM